MNRYALPLTLSALLFTPHVVCADETKQAVFAARVDDTHGSVDSAMGHYADARVHHRSRNGRVAVFVAEDVNRGGPVRRLADVGERGGTCSRATSVPRRRDRGSLSPPLPPRAATHSYDRKRGHACPGHVCRDSEFGA